MTKEEKAKELTIKNVTDGKNKYFSLGFYKGCVVGLEYNNKQIAELEEKISVLLSCKNCSENKGGWICAKEYENKCLAQKIEFIKELQKENAQLKKQQFSLRNERNTFLAQNEQYEKDLINFNENITKAKEIIREYMRFEPMIGTCSFYSEEYEKTKKKAEQFLNSEVEK